MFDSGRIAKRAARLAALMLLGVMTLAFTCAGTFSSLALPVSEAAEVAAARINTAGAAGFGIAIIALFATYPAALPDARAIMAATLPGFGGWTVAVLAGPPEGLDAVRAITFFKTLATTALAFAKAMQQWADPAKRAIAVWLGVSVLIGALSLSPTAAFVTTLGLVALTWPPLRDEVWSRIVRRRRVSETDIFANVVQSVLRPTPEDRVAAWQALAAKIFKPLEIAEGDAALATVQLDDEGKVLHLPAVLGAPALALRYKHGEQALHSDEAPRKDAMIRNTLADLRAEAGERLEPHGIALDGDDDVPAGLSLSKPEVHSLRSSTREATSNVIKHSGAARMMVMIACDTGAIRLRLGDDGCGLSESSDNAAPGKGHGLANMHTRFVSLGGEFTIASTSSGTIITAILPLGRSAAAARNGGHDLALINLALPDGLGLDVVRALRQHNPQAMVVVATVMGDDASIIAAISAGAHGHLLKDSPADLFVTQLTQLRSGYPALSPSVARLMMQLFATTAFVPEDAALLTPRESEVLCLVARGVRNVEVAERLNLTPHTVAGYIRSVYGKLGISNRAEAARRAARLGLTGF